MKNEVMPDFSSFYIGHRLTRNTRIQIIICCDRRKCNLLPVDFITPVVSVVIRVPLCPILVQSDGFVICKFGLKPED